ncbi:MULTISPECIES: hypothetical protein [Streptomyces]|jgi:hypothetical protein|uniref:Uncharacterized protein n=2 Tax=Streptomyces TaxID=1883 RepID=A0ABY6ERZ1_9ACTN|nr:MULTISPECIES: hypothetical protein [unclassified Streptomyces]OKJ86327.1 hypothetical protein AMK32_03230 [Streptomyces sp. CB01883]ROP51749.1 hypothetical protein EDD94_1182 [Streptomyces sp. PanSC9]UXY37170.1 hypothetical protein N8I86_22055 [Streptomyces sp. HUAS 14-6]
MSPAPESRSDDEVLAGTDVTLLLRYGLTEEAFRTALFGDGAIAAAVTLDRLGVLPRSLVFVAEIVRSGGLAYAAGLPEPLPSPEPAAVLRDWLSGAAQTATTPEAETRAARWLEAVAEIVALRRSARGGTA